VRKFRQGLSNHLYVITISQREKSWKALVRIHCEDEDDVGFVDRNSENKLLALLSSNHLAPIYYGRFNNGRVEEFYDGYRALSWEEMAAFGKEIATKMTELHALKISKDHHDKIFGSKPSNNPCEADIWKQVKEWINLAKSKIVQNPNDKENSSLLDYLSLQWEWLQNELSPVPKPTSCIEDIVIEFCNEIVLTHMDCQSLNILTPINANSVDAEESPIHVIDFEYAGMNTRVMDIANTFCEHCDMNNLRADYEKQYPSDTVQNDFLRTYISLARPDLVNNSNDWDQVLKAMRNQVGKHTLVSHLCWAIWALAQHYVSSIEFDYLKYASVRIEGYEYFKSKYW
jgi:thiamine kinase-like enzyme